ncbi:MAG: glutamate-cysteine ligase family protein [Candidatus Bathyarchaeota archaeon]|nr:glutamate-cysteine ligase family protein [Candidatus Bathyarchaeota archaeon]
MDGASTYKPLEVLGPEHEFALVNPDLQVLPIADKIIKGYCGRMLNFIELPEFTFGKELQLHVMEIKANEPFQSPSEFEETIQSAVSTLNGIVQKHGAMLLGTGMHPLLQLQDTAIWPHYHRKIYDAYGKIFNLNQHGWLNIQSFHLNLPYQKETDAIQIHNQLANLCAYLPAVAASSPIFEGKAGPDLDNRLQFYKANQKEVPSVAGDIIPDYVSSIGQYKRDVIGRYSKDLAAAGADETLLNREWVNSRGVIFRFDRSALEVRVMDEQECIKMDVAFACFIRATLRGLIAEKAELAPHKVLVADFNAVIKEGLATHVSSPLGETARQVCQHYLKLATQYAEGDEKKYLPLVKRRIDGGCLSELIRAKVRQRAEKTIFHEAIVDVYSTLINCLRNNEPF